MSPRAIACRVLVLVGLLPGCRETAAPASVDAAAAPTAIGDAGEAAPPDAAPTVAKIGAGAIALPGRDAIALPAAALPGRVRDDLRATYAVAALEAALRSETGPIAIELAADATASMLRNVAASAPDRALTISDRTLTPMRERAVPALRVLPVKDGFEVWEGETAIAAGKDAEAIVARVGKRTEPIAIDPRDADDAAAVRSLLAIATAISDEVSLALD